MRQRILQQLGREDYVTFCSYEAPMNNTNNWACGCAVDDLEMCRPFPRLRPWADDDADEDCGDDGCEPKEQGSRSAGKGRLDSLKARSWNGVALWDALKERKDNKCPDGWH
ncbi:hypothetical protein CYMTET_53057 [Cymbomonas tetramitiformis]|uniref:Uncharacterized protein n=1 Tax=Cymbomonas tetramitiformis TaxID=36881 RepID=A0AAE0EQ67_9CHLO|nr:hypothetical protein CYMTET_53057 [Cymbomonas tetramitiformis]